MTSQLHRISRLRGVLATAVLGSATAFALTGCNDAQGGSLLGAGVGALAGQAIGHDTEATLIGAGVGAAAGYVVGNESDKAKARTNYGEYRPGGYRHPDYDY